MPNPRTWRQYQRTAKRHYRKVARCVKFAWKHSYAMASLIFSAVVGILADRQLDISLQTQGIVTLAVLALCFAVWVYRNSGYGGVYIVRGLHPTTGVYRCIYVGLTERAPWIDSDGDQRHSRIDEHIFGISRYYKPTMRKVWADTAVDFYFAHESYWFLPGVLKFFERVNIQWRRPLYNDKMNRNNPDRIDRTKATAQRKQRDQGWFTQEYVDALQVHTPFLSRRSG